MIRLEIRPPHQFDGQTKSSENCRWTNLVLAEESRTDLDASPAFRSLLSKLAMAWLREQAHGP
jgi:hypothetical protein